MPIAGADGVTLSSKYLTPEIVNDVHRIGKTVGVWLSRGASTEDEELYDKVFGLNVDFIYLDKPLLGMNHRNLYYSN